MMRQTKELFAEQKSILAWKADRLKISQLNSNESEILKLNVSGTEI